MGIDKPFNLELRSVMDGILDVAANGEVGGAVEESPSRRWRLWYFRSDGR